LEEIKIELLKIEISAWTASFRQPLFISGVQLTYPIPPPSTIYGLLSAAKGDIVEQNDVEFGYIFKYRAKTLDLERIYEFDTKGNHKTNIHRREFLFDTSLQLYLSPIEFQKYFKKPFYPLLLGRSTDLAFVRTIKIVEAKNIKKGIVKDSIIPKNHKIERGAIYRLPIYIKSKIPRTLIDSDIFYYVNVENSIETQDTNFFQELETGNCFFMFS